MRGSAAAATHQRAARAAMVVTAATTGTCATNPAALRAAFAAAIPSWAARGTPQLRSPAPAARLPIAGAARGSSTASGVAVTALATAAAVPLALVRRAPCGRARRQRARAASAFFCLARLSRVALRSEAEDGAAGGDPTALKDPPAGSRAVEDVEEEDVEESVQARSLAEPDPRPRGPADLTDEEARDNAIYYLTKRQQIEDQKFSTEQEWIRMFSIVGDLGAAMQLGEEKEKLEAELDAMVEREAEIAEQLVEIRGIRNELRTKTDQFERLGEELTKATKDKDALMAEMTASQEVALARQAEVLELRNSAAQIQQEIEAADAAAAVAAEELAQAKALIAELEPKVAAAAGLVEPREQELRTVQAQMKALEKDSVLLASSAEKDAAELGILEGRIEELKKSKSEYQVRRDTLLADIEERQRALENLPKELADITAEVKTLCDEEAELRAALGPRGDELNLLREKRGAAQAVVDRLVEEKATAEKESAVLIKESEDLQQEKVDLENEIETITKKQAEAVADRDVVVKLVPNLIIRRNKIVNEVATAVEEARVTREELVLQARSAQQRLEQISLDSAMQGEEKLLQGTAAEVGMAARNVGEGMRQAQDAFEKALAQRQRAEDDFAKLQEAMAARFAALKSQEKSLAKCAEDHKGLDDKMQDLMVGTASQVEQFRTAREKVQKFQKEVQRISDENSAKDSEGDAKDAQVSMTSSPGTGDDDLGNAVAGAAAGAVGLFGSLLKASAAGLSNASKAARDNEQGGGAEK